MEDRSLHTALAALAQELWCRRMRRDGWRHGERFDQTARVHDALVPFESLSAPDRRLLLRSIEVLRLEESLEAAVDHQRGADRELAPEEMREGLPVRWTDSRPDGAPAAVTGRIESWEVGPDRCLRIVRVRWDDGTLSEHFPAERELARADEPC